MSISQRRGSILHCSFLTFRKPLPKLRYSNHDTESYQETRTSTKGVKTLRWIHPVCRILESVLTTWKENDIPGLGYVAGIQRVGICCVWSVLSTDLNQENTRCHKLSGRYRRRIDTDNRLFSLWCWALFSCRKFGTVCINLKPTAQNSAHVMIGTHIMSGVRQCYFKMGYVEQIVWIAWTEPTPLSLFSESVHLDTSCTPWVL